MSAPPRLRLPPGYRSRPATLTDVPAIHRLVATCERDLHGRVDTAADSIAADLARPGLDPESDTLLVHDAGGVPAGWAWVHGGRRSMIDVHPDHRGKGLGSALLAWAEERARRAGSARLAQTLPDGDRTAAGLLLSRRYQPYITQWLLRIEMPGEPEVPEAPPGITVRPFRPGDERAAYRLTEDAFDEWQQRRKPYVEWARLTVERPTFAPALSPVAFADGRMVGAVLSLAVPESDEGYIDRVAVRRDHRDRGIARSLLREAFRGFWLRGRRSCALWTHSATGALTLYERVGMTVVHGSTVFSKALDDEGDAVAGL
ncbi:GNAT family N-acetyltransferase [Streptomyces olindensis]|uniref:GNAT family N-acetyltransferase n=1 Tax=Streptomyces olindensis TaxID=358823 RepID=A0ABV2XWY2_9ACTN